MGSLVHFRTVRGEPAILHETRDWLVLNKPSGWHTVTARRGRSNDDAPDVESWLQNKFDGARGLDEGGLVHRLDQMTSGCLMVAKSATAQSRWREAFQTGDGVQKIYLAQVTPGIADRGEFDLYFSSRYKRSKKATVARTGDAKHRGRCVWRVLERHDDHDLIEVELLGPGRRHQIRAGFAFLGHPILNDDLYGGPPSARAFGLHAWKLRIGEIEIIAPLKR